MTNGIYDFRDKKWINESVRGSTDGCREKMFIMNQTIMHKAASIKLKPHDQTVKVLVALEPSSLSLAHFCIQ